MPTDDKKRFMLFADYYDKLEKLSDEQFGQLMRAVFLHERGEDVPEMELAVEIGYEFIIDQLKRDREKYDKRCEANRENGRRGGRPRKEALPDKPVETDAADEITEKTERLNSVSDKNPNNPIHDTDTDTTPLYPPKGEAAAARDESLDDKDLGEILREYERAIVSPIPSIPLNELCDVWYGKLPKELIINAIQIAESEQVRKWSYVRSILTRYEREGIVSIDRARQDRASPATRQKQKEQKAKACLLDKLL